MANRDEIWCGGFDNEKFLYGELDLDEDDWALRRNKLERDWQD